MKRLVLMRHAKSSWADPGQADGERPLNERGRLVAPLMGAWIAERIGRPDHVIVSDARRAVETWERAARLFDSPPAAVTDQRLYMADPAALMEVLRAAPAGAGSVLMIGHQPGLSGFARRLSGGAVPPHCAEAFAKFPTGAAAVIEFDLDSWAAIDWGSGRFRHFGVPKQLV
ncbi:MAG: phosphoglycerate mutase [Paracoccaceae bacterium]|nr:MAG: phosphoglycerate mutase [Paracoccaceae bacterium]